MDEMTTYRDKHPILAAGGEALKNILLEYICHPERWLPFLLKDNDNRRFYNTACTAIQVGDNIEIVREGNTLRVARGPDRVIVYGDEEEDSE